MATRATGFGGGARWLLAAVDLGRHDPKAVFGGAALMLLPMIVLLIGFAIGMFVLATVVGKEAMTTLNLAMYAFLLVMMVPAACLLVGYMRLIHAVETGHSPRATSVFAGFSDLRTSARVLGLLLLVMILQNILTYGSMALLAPDMFTLYTRSMMLAGGVGAQAGMVTPPPLGQLGVVFALAIVLGFLFYGIQTIGLGQVILGGRRVFPALADGVTGTFKNIPGLLVLALLGIAAVLVLMAVIFMLILVIVVLSKLAGDWLALVLGLPIYLIGLVVFMVVSVGVMYHLWRDVCAEEAPPSLPNAAGGFEA